MFNAEQKEEYIDNNKDRNKVLAKTMQFVFNGTEKMEAELNKDAAEWTSAEIIRYYKSCSKASLFTLTNRHSQLKQYAQWCLDNNMIRDNQNHYTEINNEILHSCLNVGLQQNGILTRKEMEEEIAQLLNPRDQCLVYALFEGIQGKEFSELTELNMSQVVKGNKLKLATRTVPVSARLIELMQQATDEYTYYAYGEKQRTFPYDPSDHNVFKRTHNATQETQVRKRQRLYTGLQRIKDYLENPAINASSLMESGRIDYIASIMDANGTELEITIRTYSEDISKKYGKISSVPMYLMNYARYFTGK